MPGNPSRRPEDWERRLSDVPVPDRLLPKLRAIRREEERLDRRLKCVPPSERFLGRLQRIARDRQAGPAWASLAAAASLLFMVCCSYLAGAFFFILSAYPQTNRVRTPLANLQPVFERALAFSPPREAALDRLPPPPDAAPPTWPSEAPAGAVSWPVADREAPRSSWPKWSGLADSIRRSDVQPIQAALPPTRPAATPFDPERILGNVTAGRNAGQGRGGSLWSDRGGLPPRSEPGYDLAFQVRHRVHPIVALSTNNAALKTVELPFSQRTTGFLIAERLVRSGPWDGLRRDRAEDLRIEDFTALVDPGVSAAATSETEGLPLRIGTAGCLSPQSGVWMSHLLQVGLRGAVPAANASVAAPRAARQWFVVLDHSDAMRADGRFLVVRDALRRWVERLPTGDRLTIVLAVAERRPQVLSIAARDARNVPRLLENWLPTGAGNSVAAWEAVGKLLRDATKSGLATGCVWFAAGEPTVVPSLSGQQATTAFRLTEAEPLRIVDLRDAPTTNWAASLPGTPLRVRAAGHAEEVAAVLDDAAGRPAPTVATEVRAVIEFNPALVAGYRLIGHEGYAVVAAGNRTAALTLRADRQTATLFELRPVAEPVEPTGSRTTAWVAKVDVSGWDVARNQPFRVRRTVHPDELKGTWSDAPAGLQRTSLAAAAAERFRGTIYSHGISWPRLEELAGQVSAVAADDPGYRRVREFVLAAARAGARGGRIGTGSP